MRGLYTAPVVGAGYLARLHVIGDAFAVLPTVFRLRRRTFAHEGRLSLGARPDLLFALANLCGSHSSLRSNNDSDASG